MSLYEQVNDEAIRTIKLTNWIAGNYNCGAYSTYYTRSWYNDSGHHEALFQLLGGYVEPHIERDGTQIGFDYYWTMFNFTECKVEDWFCWGNEPSFALVAELSE